MAEVIDELLIKIGADLSELKGELKKAGVVSKTTSKDISKNMKDTGGAVEFLRGKFLAVAAAIAATATVAKVFSGIMNAFAQGDALGKTADKLGIATDRLAGLRLAAQETANMTSGPFDTALQRMVRRLAEAADGTGEAQKALIELGIDAQKIANQSPDEQFLQIADAWQEVAKQGDKVKISMRLFDTEGVALLNTLDQGRVVLEGFQKEANELGIALTRVDARSMEMVNDAFNRAKLAGEGLFNVLAIEIAPALSAAAALVTVFAKSFQTAGDEVGAFGTITTGIIKIVANLVHGLLIGWELAKVAAAAFWVASAEGAKFAISVLRDIAVRIDGVGQIFEGVMEDPIGAFKLAWATINGVVLKGIRDILLNMRLFVFKMTESLKALGFQETGQGLADSFGDALDGLNIKISDSKRAVDGLKESSEGLEAVGEGINKVLGNVEPPEGGIFSGLQEEIDNFSKGAQESLLSQQGELLETINLFGGKSGGEFIQGQIDAFEARKGEFAEKVKASTPGGEDDVDPEEDPRVMREAAIQDAIVKIKQKEFDQDIQREAERRNFFESSLENRLSVASSILGDLSSLMEGKSKKLFKIGKAAAISQAIVDMWAGANKAMSTLPYPVNLVAAAATVAAGSINVQKIAARKFGSGSSGGTGGGGGGGGANVSAAAGASEAPAAPSQTFNIGLQGQNFSGQSVRGLLNQINDQLDDNAQINVIDGVQ